MKSIHSKLVGLLREILPGFGIGFVMMLLYVVIAPFLLLLVALAVYLWFFPLIFVVAYSVAGNYFKAFFCGIICMAVLFGEYRFYKWLSMRDSSKPPTLYM